MSPKPPETRPLHGRTATGKKYCPRIWVSLEHKVNLPFDTVLRQFAHRIAQPPVYHRKAFPAGHASDAQFDRQR